MALDPVVNFFRSTIATLPLNSGTTTMVVASGDGNKLPNPSVDGAFNLVVYNPSDPFVAPEIVRCTARTSDTLTILRGQEGTSDATKAAGIAWTVELVPTAKMIQNIDTNKVEKTGDSMTGTLTATKLIPSGNVTAGNGMYLPAANTLALSTNGAERVRVISTGEVGIAKTPTAGVALDVTGAVTASGLVTAGKFAPTANTTAGNGMYLPATNTVAIGTDGTEAMRIDASQRVAIDTTTQVMRFNVQNTGIVGGTARTPNANNTTVSIYTISCGTATGSSASSVANGILKLAIIARTTSCDANASYTLPFLLLRRGRSTGSVILEQGTPTLIANSGTPGCSDIDSVAVALSSASNTGATLDVTITTSGSQAIANLSFNSSIELTQHQTGSTFFTITAA